MLLLIRQGERSVHCGFDLGSMRECPEAVFGSRAKMRVHFLFQVEEHQQQEVSRTCFENRERYL